MIHTWSSGRSKSAAANAPAGAVRHRCGPLPRGPGQYRGERGKPGIVRHRLLDERDQIAQGATLDAHVHELCAEDRGGVGLAAVGADLERLRGQLFGLIGVAGDLARLARA